MAMIHSSVQRLISAGGAGSRQLPQPRGIELPAIRPEELREETLDAARQPGLCPLVDTAMSRSPRRSSAGSESC